MTHKKYIETSELEFQKRITEKGIDIENLSAARNPKEAEEYSKSHYPQPLIIVARQKNHFISLKDILDIYNPKTMKPIELKEGKCPSCNKEAMLEFYDHYKGFDLYNCLKCGSTVTPNSVRTFDLSEKWKNYFFAHKNLKMQRI